MLWAVRHPLKAFKKRRKVADRILSRILSEEQFAKWHGHKSPTEYEEQLAAAVDGTESTRISLHFVLTLNALPLLVLRA